MNYGQTITVIGGGIVGLCSAYYLEKKGFRVTIVDQSSLKSGCSVGNAGMIVPSHFIPLSQPGMISKGLKWMFDSKSPFYIKPRLSGDLIKWGLKFYQSSNQQHVSKSIPILQDLNLKSKLLYEELTHEIGQFGFQKKGLIMYCKSQKAFDEEIKVAHKAIKSGLKASILDNKAAQKLDPNVTLDITGGVYYPEDAFLSPSTLIDQLVSYLRQKSVKIINHTKVDSVLMKNGEISGIQTSEGVISSDQYVIATGSWTPLLTKKLGLNILMQAGKGYSFTIPNPVEKPQICSILAEAKVAVTPMDNGLRFAGTMEIGGINSIINKNRVMGIKTSIPQYFPAFGINTIPDVEIWSGLRPCSPDGLPYIGRTKQVKNLIVATGHGMMGLSMGPVTGKIVSELVAEEKTKIDLKAVDVDRFS